MTYNNPSESQIVQILPAQIRANKKYENNLHASKIVSFADSEMSGYIIAYDRREICGSTGFLADIYLHSDNNYEIIFSDYVFEATYVPNGATGHIHITGTGGICSHDYSYNCDILIEWNATHLVTSLSGADKYN